MLEGWCIFSVCYECIALEVSVLAGMDIFLALEYGSF